MNSNYQRHAADAADALRRWLSGEADAPLVLERVLSHVGLHAARPFLRAVRARLRATRRSNPVLVAQRTSTTPEASHAVCHLACMAHPDGFLREEAARLVATSSAMGCAAAMIAADDHVAAVRRRGRAGLKRSPIEQLARRADRVVEDAYGPERARWRADARQRLASPDGCTALRQVAASVTDTAAEAALKLLLSAHGWTRDDATALATAADWRVRRQVARRAVEQDWAELLPALASDQRASVRRALLSSVIDHPTALRDAVVSRLANDRCASIARVAAFYGRGQPAVVDAVRTRLGATGARRRRALVPAAVLLPGEARRVASDMLGSSAADRAAAVTALLDTGGLEPHHLELAAQETARTVRRALARSSGHGALARSWAEDDGRAVLPPIREGHVASLPTVLQGLAHGEPWAPRHAVLVERAIRREHLQGWRTPSAQMAQQARDALARWGTAAAATAPDLVAAATRWLDDTA